MVLVQQSELAAQDLLRSTSPSSSEVLLAPYVRLGDQWSLPDDFVTAFAGRMLEEGTLPLVFYDGSVRTPEEFLAFVQKPINLPVFFFYGDEPLGVAWLNGLHGGVGEDGTVQRMVELVGVPYAGSRALAAGIALNKNRARETLQSAGVRIPRGVSFSHRNDLNTAEMARLTFSQFGPPYIVKPVSEGAGRGVTVAASIIELPDDTLPNKSS